jgi:hypothetical protein
MNQMELDALRKEDEIRTRPKVVSTMQQIFKQALPRPSSRHVVTPPWPTFKPIRPQSIPPWVARRRVTFRDISWIQKGCEVASVNERFDGDDWDQNASRVFQVPMKVIDERIEAETDDVMLPLRERHQWASRDFRPAGPTIASNASPSDVEGAARGLWGQALKPRPIAWTPNALYHFQLTTDLKIQVISADTRASLARQKGVDEVSVSIVMVHGRAQFREKNSILRRDVGSHGIIDAWWAATHDCGHEIGLLQ